MAETPLDRIQARLAKADKTTVLMSVRYLDLLDLVAERATLLARAEAAEAQIETAYVWLDEAGYFEPRNKSLTEHFAAKLRTANEITADLRAAQVRIEELEEQGRQWLSLRDEALTACRASCVEATRRAETAERRVLSLEEFVTKALAYYEIQGEYSNLDDSVRIYDDDLHARYKKAMDAYYDVVRALQKTRVAPDIGQEGGKGA